MSKMRLVTMMSRMGEVIYIINACRESTSKRPSENPDDPASGMCSVPLLVETAAPYWVRVSREMYEKEAERNSLGKPPGTADQLTVLAQMQRDGAGGQRDRV